MSLPGHARASDLVCAAQGWVPSAVAEVLLGLQDCAKGAGCVACRLWACVRRHARRSNTVCLSKQSPPVARDGALATSIST